MRCFISIDVEDNNILDRLEEAQRSLIGTRADLRCVKRENIHVTLKFLGEVSEGYVGELVRLVSSTSFNPFSIKLEGLGAFPNLKRPRVIWVGISEGVEELTKIFRHIDHELFGLGFKKERRGFSAHITLARVRSGRNREKLTQEVTERSDQFYGLLRVDNIRLKKSLLTPRGPIYSTIAKSEG